MIIWILNFIRIYSRWNQSNSPIDGTTTKSTGVSRCQSNISVLSPVCAPWVLYFPISWCHSYELNSMVKRSSAFGKYSWWITVPLSCINCSSQGSCHQSILNSCAASNTSNVSNFVSTSLLFAILCFSNIRIFWTKSNSMILNIFHSCYGSSTITAMIPIGTRTVNQLLFRKYEILFSFSIIWLNNSNCRKCPAWSTLSLVLDRGHHSFGHPINISAYLHTCINILSFNWNRIQIP